LVYHNSTKIAYLVIDKIDIVRCNSNYTEASRIIELLENVQEIAVIYLIIKNGNKLSIKARSDEIDVCKIMKCYGGGGHKNAAGTSRYHCKNIYKFIEELILKTKSILNLERSNRYIER
jgi:nanoRNase/pAp phosphatase (c-di-AMP/oligoRNAs hydrolase)